MYNTAKFLPKCLDSVVGQTLQNLEIICIDDGSTDNSLEILREYEQKDSRVKVITKPNQGCWTARNAGLDIATGEYVAFVDSDDYLELERVHISAKNTKANPICYLKCENSKNFQEYCHKKSLAIQMKRMLLWLTKKHKRFLCILSEVAVRYKEKIKPIDLL